MDKPPSDEFMKALLCHTLGVSPDEKVLDLISKIKENSNEENQADAVTRRNDKV